ENASNNSSEDSSEDEDLSEEDNKEDEEISEEESDDEQDDDELLDDSLGYAVLTIYFVDPLPKDAKAIGQIYRVMISLAITRIVSTLVVSQEAQAKYTKRKRGSIPFEENKRSRTRRSVALEDAKKLEFQRNFRAVCDGLANRELFSTCKDGSKGLGMSSLKPEDAVADYSGLNENDRKVLDDWHAFFSKPSFLRVTEPKTTKVKFEPLEYFDITITSRIAYGATGDTHAATTDFLGSTTNTFLSTMSLSSSLSPMSRGRGYNMSSLSSWKTLVPRPGIADFLINPNDSKQRFRNQKTGFLDALKYIHSAGVRHRDLRLENLTIDHEAHPYIIDFNRAALDADEIFLDREDKTFLALLNGEHESCLSRETQEPDAESDGS
ncbi:hypothetical protein E4T56_gene14202, partial [Termitomyces sp. T112]